MSTYFKYKETTPTGKGNYRLIYHKYNFDSSGTLEGSSFGSVSGTIGTLQYKGVKFAIGSKRKFNSEKDARAVATIEQAVINNSDSVFFTAVLIYVVDIDRFGEEILYKSTLSRAESIALWSAHRYLWDIEVNTKEQVSKFIETAIKLNMDQEQLPENIEVTAKHNDYYMDNVFEFISNMTADELAENIASYYKYTEPSFFRGQMAAWIDKHHEEISVEYITFNDALRRCLSDVYYAAPHTLNVDYPLVSFYDKLGHPGSTLFDRMSRSEDSALMKEFQNYYDTVYGTYEMKYNRLLKMMSEYAATSGDNTFKEKFKLYI